MSAISHNALVGVEPLLRYIPDISTSCSSGHLIGPKFLLILLLKGGHVAGKGALFVSKSDLPL